jgi:hypothetical protein
MQETLAPPEHVNRPGTIPANSCCYPRTIGFEGSAVKEEVLLRLRRRTACRSNKPVDRKAIRVTTASASTVTNGRQRHVQVRRTTARQSTRMHSGIPASPYGMAYVAIRRTLDSMSTYENIPFYASLTSYASHLVTSRTCILGG